MNVAQHVDRADRHFPEKPAIIFESREISYRELRQRVDRAADGLAEMGIALGDRVALFLPNIPEFAVAYLAAQKLGAIAVSVNSMLTTDELRHVLTDSGAGVVFTTAALLPALQPLIGAELSPSNVIMCEGEPESGAAVGLEQLGAGRDGSFEAAELEPDAPSAILYTSGTTGRQKGAVLSHGNVVSNCSLTRHYVGIRPADRLLLFLPLFHCFGQNFIMNAAFNAGATLVLHRRFDPERVVDSIERDGVTLFFAVPTIYIALLNTGLEPQRLASVRYYFSAAATMPQEIAHRWRETYGLPIYEGYGLTETSPFACYNHEWGYRPGSVGTPLDTVEMKVVDAEGRALGPGTWGEICIKGPNVMLGYWNRPRETAEVVRDDWFHSGDVGYVDEDGYFFLVDRTKDMINSAGFKIWPREVEEVLYEHPAIRECAVVAAPDAEKGEVAVAVVVIKEGQAAESDTLQEYCRAHLAAYKVPRQFTFAEALPKSATGKILKRVLREQLARPEQTAV